MKLSRLYVFLCLVLLATGILFARTARTARTPAVQGGPTQLYGLDGLTRADVTVGHALKTDASATTQPVSAASLPLPAGASTAANQATIISALGGGLPSSLDSNAVRVALENSPTVSVSSVFGAIYTGQTKVAVTGTAVVLGSSQAISNGVTLTASIANAGAIYIGGASVNNTAPPSGNGYVLNPGQTSPRLPLSNINLVYINGTANDYVTYEAN